jgi:hypothetical protein
MRILKSIGVGVLAAIVAAAGWVAVRLVVTAVAVSPQMTGSGAGGIGFVVDTTDVSFLAPAVVGFLIGFVWTLRRASRAARTSR